MTFNVNNAKKNLKNHYQINYLENCDLNEIYSM